jgi:catechol 2,3-dioxygenase-like lactoylglutathione lyase family enzyme
MLGDQEATATIAVKDLDVARKFYGNTLGLKLADERDHEALTYTSGDSMIFVYRSQFAGTNRATAMTWVVGDVPGTVSDLKGKGVAFEHYDLPGMKLEGDVHVADGMKAAWFKDPDGNILSIVDS